MKRFYIFKDGTMQSSTATKELAIDLIRQYQKLETHPLLRNFFEYVSNQSPLRERIITTGSYLFVYERINQQIMEHEKERSRGVFGLDEASENIVFAYYGSITGILYRQWVTDGRQLPLDSVIDLATKLICDGMSSVIK